MILTAPVLVDDLIRKTPLTSARPSLSGSLLPAMMLLSSSWSLLSAFAVVLALASVVSSQTLTFTWPKYPEATVLIRPYVQSRITLAVERNLVKSVTRHGEASAGAYSI